MGKHAYLIMAHQNRWQLQVLLRLLDDERNDIFIHVDKKVKSFDEKKIIDICKKSKVWIYREVSCYWGGYSIVKCEMSLFQHAYETSRYSKNMKYDYYHLISGSDLPLKTQDSMHEFFDNNAEYNYVRFDDDYSDSKSCVQRVKYYYFPYGLLVIKHFPVFRYINFGFKLFQKMLCMNRWKNSPFHLYYGSQWVSLKEDAVECILKKKTIIERLFRFTSCPDELYKQTILRNAGYQFYSVENKDFVKSCLRYIDFSEHKPHPKTITMEDYDKVMNSGALFARKFDENVDREVILRIYKVLSGKRNNERDNQSLNLHH